MRIENGRLTGVLDADGELSDEAAKHIIDVLKTKAAILEYVEPIAQVLAEAGRASETAMGDPADSAIDRWVNVIRERAHDILREERRPKRKQIEPRTLDAKPSTPCP